MERHAHEVLDVAYDAGVRYFDAARSYGRAEAFLASWLASRDVEVTVGSKWGYTYTADWEIDADPPEVKDLSAEAFRRQVAETRELLGDRLALYQIHSATVESGVLEDPEVLEGLAELREQGVAIGLSATGADQAATIEQAVATGAFDTVQATFNVLEPSAGPALERAHAAGMGVIVKEAVANGRLTARGDQPEFLAMAEQRGVAPDALALAYVLGRPVGRRRAERRGDRRAAGEQPAGARRGVAGGARGAAPRRWRSRRRLLGSALGAGVELKRRRGDGAGVLGVVEKPQIWRKIDGTPDSALPSRRCGPRLELVHGAPGRQLTWFRPQSPAHLCRRPARAPLQGPIRHRRRRRPTRRRCRRIRLPRRSDGAGAGRLARGYEERRDAIRFRTVARFLCLRS